MKRFKKNTKIKIILPLFLIMVLTTVGLTAAYLQAKTSNLTNTFTVGDITTEIEEDPSIGTTIKKNPSVVNIGKNDAIIRMRVTISPSSISQFLVDHNSINYDNENWLYNDTDGFWYYQGIVQPGKATTPLFTEVNNLIKDGKIINQFKNIDDFQITLYQEAVQSIVWNEQGESKAAYDANGNYVQTDAEAIWRLYEAENK